MSQGGREDPSLHVGIPEYWRPVRVPRDEGVTVEESIHVDIFLPPEVGVCLFLNLRVHFPFIPLNFASGLPLHPKSGLSIPSDSVLSPQLIGATGISYGFNLSGRFNVDTVGEIPTG